MAKNKFSGLISGVFGVFAVAFAVVASVAGIKYVTEHDIFGSGSSEPSIITTSDDTTSEQPITSEDPITSENPTTSEVPVTSEPPVTSEEPTIVEEYKIILSKNQNFYISLRGPGLTGSQGDQLFDYGNLKSFTITEDHFIYVFLPFNVNDDYYSSALSIYGGENVGTWSFTEETPKPFGEYDFSSITITEANQVLVPIYHQLIVEEPTIVDEYKIILSKNQNFYISLRGPGLTGSQGDQLFDYGNLKSFTITEDHFIYVFLPFNVNDDYYSSALSIYGGENVGTWSFTEETPKPFGEYDFSSITITEANQVLVPIYHQETTNH